MKLRMSTFFSDNYIKHIYQFQLSFYQKPITKKLPYQNYVHE